MSVEPIVEELRVREAQAAGTVEALRSFERQVQEQSKQLEGPKAALDHIAFFADMFTRAAADIASIAAQLPEGVTRAHVEALRQIASNSAAEQRRSVLFRDKWINKPLPYEQMRPLLTGLSNAVRDQLTAFRGLNETASALDALVSAEPPQEDTSRRAFDRRALFTKLFKAEEEREE